MYEMKNKSPVDKIIRGDFDAEQLEKHALQKYIDVPSFMTCVRHAALQDETPVHCFLEGDPAQVNFLVPKQSLDSRRGPDGHQYLVLVVLKEGDISGKFYKLVMCHNNRTGFLVNNIDL